MFSNQALPPPFVGKRLAIRSKYCPSFDSLALTAILSPGQISAGASKNILEGGGDEGNVIVTLLPPDHSEMMPGCLACALTVYIPGLDQECEALGEDDQLE